MIIAVLCWTTFKDLSLVFCVINFPAFTKSQSFMLCYFYCHCSFSIAHISFLKYKVIMFFFFEASFFFYDGWAEKFFSHFFFSLQLGNRTETQQRLYLQGTGFASVNGPIFKPRFIKTFAARVQSRNLKGQMWILPLGLVIKVKRLFNRFLCGGSALSRPSFRVRLHRQWVISAEQRALLTGFKGLAVWPASEAGVAFNLGTPPVRSVRSYAWRGSSRTSLRPSQAWPVLSCLAVTLRQYTHTPLGPFTRRPQFVTFHTRWSLLWSEMSFPRKKCHKSPMINLLVRLLQLSPV